MSWLGVFGYIRLLSRVECALEDSLLTHTRGNAYRRMIRFSPDQGREEENISLGLKTREIGFEEVNWNSPYSR